jgi:cytochrome c biogenesis protein CcdA
MLEWIFLVTCPIWVTHVPISNTFLIFIKINSVKSMAHQSSLGGVITFFSHCFFSWTEETFVHICAEKDTQHKWLVLFALFLFNLLCVFWFMLTVFKRHTSLLRNFAGLWKWLSWQCMIIWAWVPSIHMKRLSLSSGDVEYRDKQILRAHGLSHLIELVRSVERPWLKN